MNNKGFTLVELLAVMVILLAISVVAVTNITSSLDKNDKREAKAWEQQAMNAAKIYFSMNDDADDTVSIVDLINQGYLKDNPKFDEIKCTNVTPSPSLRNCFVKIGSNNYEVTTSSGNKCFKN